MRRVFVWLLCMGFLLPFYAGCGRNAVHEKLPIDYNGSASLGILPGTDEWFNTM